MRPGIVARAAPGDGRAAVEPSFGAGSAVLAGSAGEVRLAWANGEAERARSIAPGAWRLRNTWLERSGDGVAWFLSHSGPPGDAMEARAGEPLRIEVEELVRFAGRVRLEGRTLVLEFGVTGDRGRGASVWRDGKRVPVTYRAFAKGGEEIASGTANYG